MTWLAMFFSDFSRAKPLKELYKNPLIVQNYDYNNSPDRELFLKIKRNFMVRITINISYNILLINIKNSTFVTFSV